MLLKDILLSIVLFIVSGIGFYSFSSIKSSKGIGPSFFPHMLLTCLLAGALYLLIKSLWAAYKEKGLSSFSIKMDKKIVIYVTLFWICVVGYVFLFIKTNMIISTCIFVFIAQFIFGRRRVISNGILALGISIVTYYLLTLAFQVPL